MKAGTKVRLTKVGAAQDAKYPTPQKDAYIPGGLNDGVSLPLDYESEGLLVGDVEVGRRIYMDRTHRNGVFAIGELISSPVVSIRPSANGKGLLVITGNSMYRLEEM